MKPISCENFFLDDTWDAIVVGSGIGGLASAAFLSRYAGKRVLVLERHYVPGGYTHVFHRPGYEWDVGLHYIGKVQNPDSQTAARLRSCHRCTARLGSDAGCLRSVRHRGSNL